MLVVTKPDDSMQRTYFTVFSYKILECYALILSCFYTKSDLVISSQPYIVFTVSDEKVSGPKLSGSKLAGGGGNKQ